MKGSERVVAEAEFEAEEARAALEARRAQAEALIHRLESLGYQVVDSYVPERRRHEAIALWGNNVAGWGYGASRLEALQALEGDLEEVRR